LGLILAAFVEDDVLETVGRRGRKLEKGLDESIGEVAPDARNDPTMGIWPMVASVTVSTRETPVSEEAPELRSVLCDS